MKEYVILSGKGGTGKTSLTAAFAQMADKPVICDADVDAADLHLLLRPDIQSKNPFMGGNLADIDKQVCSGCGTCRELCRFDAISDDYVIDPVRCEGCGVCVDFCPEEAIRFPQQQCGEWFFSKTSVGPMIHARLGIAEENSGKLVSLVRKQARFEAEQGGYTTILTDGPPGIGCPVIASLSGADRVIIIVEPTQSGAHDIKRVITLVKHFGLQAMLCVNRFDINEQLTEKIEDIAEAEGVSVLPRVPFDVDFVKAMVKGKTILEYRPDSSAAEKVREVWDAVYHYKDQSPNNQIHLQRYERQ